MSKTYDSATVELAMTLSTLAYVDENRTATQQQMIKRNQRWSGTGGIQGLAGRLGTGSECRPQQFGLGREEQSDRPTRS
jgi:hypothetical protein